MEGVLFSGTSAREKALTLREVSVSEGLGVLPRKQDMREGCCGGKILTLRGRTSSRLA